MHSFETLPEGYREYDAIDLQTNKKLMVLVNVLAIVIGVALVVPMLWIVPFSVSFEGGKGMYFCRLAVLFVLMVVYMILHELVHGAAMKLCGTKKVTYGFKGVYAFAGSDDYYRKKPYIFIALAPVVLWGAVIAVATLLVPREWFWVAYMLQVSNLSGAAGDLYVTVRFSRFPKDILIKDYGVGMTVYAKE